MTKDLSAYELDDRIALVRDNLRRLTEQATAFFGKRRRRPHRGPNCATVRRIGGFAYPQSLLLGRELAEFFCRRQTDPTLPVHRGAAPPAGR